MLTQSPSPRSPEVLQGDHTPAQICWGNTQQRIRLCRRQANLDTLCPLATDTHGLDGKPDNEAAEGSPPDSIIDDQTAIPEFDQHGDRRCPGDPKIEPGATRIAVTDDRGTQRHGIGRTCEIPPSIRLAVEVHSSHPSRLRKGEDTAIAHALAFAVDDFEVVDQLHRQAQPHSALRHGPPGKETWAAAISWRCGTHSSLVVAWHDVVLADPRAQFIAHRISLTDRESRQRS
ncbi:hypothetical protein [Nocardia sp. NPDC050793]|uniref:hypothetical protein n=1 Tax=Nocardia sp. NPDC050793 TaxID=3155159 RepID=UPI0033CC72B5